MGTCNFEIIVWFLVGNKVDWLSSRASSILLHKISYLLEASKVLRTCVLFFIEKVRKANVVPFPKGSDSDRIGARMGALNQSNMTHTQVFHYKWKGHVRACSNNNSMQMISKSERKRGSQGMFDEQPLVNLRQR